MAQIFGSIKQKLDGHLSDEKSPLTPLFVYLEGKTQISRIYLALGFICLTILYLIYGYAAQLLCNFIGFAYPAYASMKAIESNHKDDDTKWLTYWTVFALFTLIEFPTNVLLSWFPFYWLAKCIFMIWLFAPISNNGSMVLYGLVKPHVAKHFGCIDGMLSQLAESAKKAALNAGKNSKAE